MRPSLAIVLFAAVLAGCGTGSGERRNGAMSPERDSTAAAAHIEKCVDGFLSRSTTSGGSEQQVRRYIRDTYCAPFEQNGWVYDDGALSIAAQKWLDNGGKCATASDTEPARTVPCEQMNRDTATRIIDCALLHHVRRTEVMAYVAELQRDGDVHCDDGTPLEELGVP
ncbi:MAG: hypothetical protein ACXVRU_10840 [Gaiellaceae bacterium]